MNLMRSFAAPERVKIVYFTGTGGTAMAAGNLADALCARGVTVWLEEIHAQKTPPQTGAEDLLILMYPVYALNAPEPVYGYIKKRGPVQNLPAAVISVSGGGEVTPNRACRQHVIQRLEKQGYQVVYERMLVMPSNAISATPFDAAVTLVRLLPEKTRRIADDLLAGVCRRTKPGLLNSTLAAFGELQKQGAKRLSMSAGPSCNGCGVCWSGCPTGNITREGDRPRFGKSCAMCLKCVYRCPQKAITSQLKYFITFKEGFSLSDIVRAAAAEPASPGTALPNSIVWKGIKKYIEEAD